LGLDEVCVGPVLPKDYMIIHIKFNTGKQHYYAANPADFYLSGTSKSIKKNCFNRIAIVKVSNFKRRFEWLFFVPIDLPEMWSKFFKYAHYSI